MDKLIDMNNHTSFSDGELTPMEIVEHAYNNNVSIMAITNHDTLNGVLNIDRNNPILRNITVYMV